MNGDSNSKLLLVLERGWTLNSTFVSAILVSKRRRLESGCYYVDFICPATVSLSGEDEDIEDFLFVSEKLGINQPWHIS